MINQNKQIELTKTILHTNGFLFNKRIFPQANDNRVRCNSASSKKDNKTNIYMDRLKSNDYERIFVCS